MQWLMQHHSGERALASNHAKTPPVSSSESANFLPLPGELGLLDLVPCILLIQSGQFGAHGVCDPLHVCMIACVSHTAVHVVLCRSRTRFRFASRRCLAWCSDASALRAFWFAWNV